VFIGTSLITSDNSWLVFPPYISGRILNISPKKKKKKKEEKEKEEEKEGRRNNSSLNVAMLSFSMPRYWAGSKILLFIFLT